MSTKDPNLSCHLIQKHSRNYIHGITLQKKTILVVSHPLFSQIQRQASPCFHVFVSSLRKIAMCQTGLSKQKAKLERNGEVGSWIHTNKQTEKETGGTPWNLPRLQLSHTQHCKQAPPPSPAPSMTVKYVFFSRGRLYRLRMGSATSSSNPNPFISVSQMRNLPFLLVRSFH